MVKRRGQGRPAKVRIYKETKAEEKAKLDAQDEHDAKGLMGLLPFSVRGKKRLTASLATHIGKAIDRTDIPELIALVGLTYVIKSLIDASEELRGLASKLRGKQPSPVIALAPSVLGALMPVGVSGEGMFPDWADWLIAFSLAFIIVRHGDVILSELGGAVTNLSALIGLMMA